MSCIRNKSLSALAFEKTPEQSKVLTRPKPSYTINENEMRTLMSQCHSVPFLHDQYQKLLSNQYHWIDETCYIWEKSTEKSIIILYLKNKASSINKFTVLFSHDVCSDLGKIYPFLYDLSTQLKCDVIAYDYSGYGRSTGTFKETEVTNDIEAVGNFINYQQIGFSSIVVFGQSIGCIPSIHFSRQNRTIAGLILMSPLSFSDYNKMKNCNKNEKNIYNLSDIKDICCPILIIHGQKDELVPYTNSDEIAKQMSAVNRWFPKSGKHLNIYEKSRKTFLKKVNDFFWIINDFNKKSLNKGMSYSMKFSLDNKSTVEDEKQTGSIGDLNIIKKEEEDNSSIDNNEYKPQGVYENSLVDEEENERNQRMEEEFNKTKKRGIHKKIKFV